VNRLEDAIKDTIEQLNQDPEDLEERTEEATIKIDKIAETQDTGDPAYKVEKGDSWMDLVHHKKEDRLYISHVWMQYKGDFSDIMDYLVNRFKTDKIKFTMVINDNLKKVLNGFTEKKEPHEGFNEEMTVLVGRWKK